MTGSLVMPNDGGFGAAGVNVPLSPLVFESPRVKAGLDVPSSFILSLDCDPNWNPTGCPVTLFDFAVSFDEDFLFFFASLPLSSS